MPATDTRLAVSEWLPSINKVIPGHQVKLLPK